MRALHTHHDSVKTIRITLSFVRSTRRNVGCRFLFTHTGKHTVQAKFRESPNLILSRVSFVLGVCAWVAFCDLFTSLPLWLPVVCVSLPFHRHIHSHAPTSTAQTRTHNFTRPTHLPSGIRKSFQIRLPCATRSRSRCASESTREITATNIRRGPDGSELTAAKHWGQIQPTNHHLFQFVKHQPRNDSSMMANTQQPKSVYVPSNSLKRRFS